MIVTPPESRRFLRFIFAASLLLAVAYLTAGCWLLNSWNHRTVDVFLTHARGSRIADCRAMFAEEPGGDYLLDEWNLRFAAELPLQTEPRSFIDFVRGRQRFEVYIAYSNDHSFTVEYGRMKLGNAFRVVPAPPEFLKLAKQVQAMESPAHRQEIESHHDEIP